MTTTWGQKLAELRLRAGYSTIEAFINDIALEVPSLSMERSLWSKYENDPKRIPKKRQRLLDIICFFVDKNVLSEVEEINRWLAMASQGFLTQDESFSLFHQEKEVIPQSLSDALLNKNVPKYGILKEVSYIPHPVNTSYVIRPQLMQTIAKMLTEVGSQGIVAITGLTGVGKTQTAIEFAHRYGQFFEGGVFWVSFVNNESIIYDFQNCGGPRGLDLPEKFYNMSHEQQLQMVLRQWETNIPRLLIFDNCDDPIQLKRYRPTHGECHLLITTHRQTWPIELNIQSLNLEPFTKSDATKFLGHFRPDITEQEAESLISYTGNLPSALHMAGSYLKQRKSLTISSYFKELKTERFTHYSWVTNNSQNATHHLWNILFLAYINLKEKNKKAWYSLNIIAYFMPNYPIPHNLIMCVGNITKSELPDLVDSLVTSGFISTTTNGEVLLHPLFAEFLQVQDNQKSFFSDLVELLFNQLCYTEPNTSRFIDFVEEIFSWKPHLEYIHQNITYPNRLIYADFLMITSKILSSFYLKKDTEQNFVRRHITQEIYKSLLQKSPNNKNIQQRVALATYYLASVYGSQGNYPKSLNQCEEALQYLQNIENDIKATFLQSLIVNDMGYYYGMLGDKKKALNYYEQALDIKKNILDEEHPSLTSTLHNLGTIYAKLGDLEKGKKLLTQALHQRQKYLEMDRSAYRSVAISAQVLASTVLWESGKKEEAWVYLNLAINTIEKSETKDYGKVKANILLQKIKFLIGEKQYTEAIAELLVIEQFVAERIPESNYTWGSIYEYFGDAEAELGNKYQAESYYQKALHIFNQCNAIDRIKKIDQKLKELNFT